VTDEPEKPADPMGQIPDDIAPPDAEPEPSVAEPESPAETPAKADEPLSVPAAPAGQPHGDAAPMDLPDTGEPVDHEKEPPESVDEDATSEDRTQGDEPPDDETADDAEEPVEASAGDREEPETSTTGRDEESKEATSENMDWYILKVQSNREDSIREALLRRVKIAGMESFFGDIIVPTEMVTEFKGGKRRIMKRKLYPGYLVIQMEINDETWFLVRETPGIGDFTGAAGSPTPMQPHEVARIIAKKEEKEDETPKLKIGFHSGDRVKINEGTFENFEGEVDSIDETNGRVTVMINIFGRSTPVELEYWQIESL
jgi:transcriptional antiterminator NusG